MPSRRPVKPRPSVVVALTATRAASMPSISAMRARMASRCGAILGASHRMVTSTLPMLPPRARAPGAAASREEEVRRRAFPARIGVGEMLADVAVADGAEQRVGQRVQRHVGVGMAFERVRVGDSDAAQPDMVAGDQAMHVEALPGAHVGWRCEPRSAMARSSAVVSLWLASRCP